MNAEDLRKDILDMVNWAVEDGMPYWEVYGVISSLEKHIEVVYTSNLLNGKETWNENKTN